MDSYNGYKLKPSSYQIQPNDVIIRVKNGTTRAPVGLLGISIGNNCVSFPKQPKWGTDYTDWRAIETKPGFEATVGDTVYCIEDTGGSCCRHDTVKVHRFNRASNCIYPADSQKLRNNHITCSSWSWKVNYFVVLTTVDSKSEFPWTKKEKLKGNIEIENVTSFISPDPLTIVSIDSMMNKPTQTKPNTKGKQMNSSLFTDMLKLLTQVEQTDLQKAPSAYAFFYNEDGEYEGTAKVANETEAKALLQRPEHLGYTMRIYSFSEEFTTQIPVVSTIKKTVSAKPAIKPRKPRTPKAD